MIRLMITPKYRKLMINMPIRTIFQNPLQQSQKQLEKMNHKAEKELQEMNYADDFIKRERSSP